MTRHLLCVVFVRLPIFCLALFALGVCAVVMWVYEQVPKDWMENQ